MAHFANTTKTFTPLMTTLTRLSLTSYSQRGQLVTELTVTEG